MSAYDDGWRDAIAAAAHDLKTWPQPFAAIWSGLKRHEVRKADRNYQRGDRVTLREYNPFEVAGTPAGYTGRIIFATIGYITQPGEWGIPDGLCVFSLLGVATNGRVAPPATPAEHHPFVTIWGSNGKVCGRCSLAPDAAVHATPAEGREANYPCEDCGAPRTKAQGGTVFTVCDACWDKAHAPPPATAGECATCGGSGRDVGSAGGAGWNLPCPNCRRCIACGGTGEVTEMYHGYAPTQVKCDDCGGAGAVAR